jgi:hypothetical protein
MRRLRVPAALALAATLALAVALPATATTLPMSKMRAFHASPDTPAVDIYVNGARVLENVAYKTVSPYLPLPAYKTYQVGVKVWDADADDAGDPWALGPRAVYLGKAPTTVAAIGSLAYRLDADTSNNARALRLRVYRDSVGIAGNWARVRFSHAVPDAPPVDVQVRLGGHWVTIASNLGFGQASPYVSLRQRTWWGAIQYRFRVKLHGTSTVIATYTRTLYKAQTVWAIGFAKPADFGSTNGLALLRTRDGRN